MVIFAYRRVAISTTLLIPYEIKGIDDFLGGVKIIDTPTSKALKSR